MLRQALVDVVVERMAARLVEVGPDVLVGLDQVEVQVVEVEEGTPRHADHVWQIGGIGLGEYLRDRLRRARLESSDDERSVHLARLRCLLVPAARPADFATLASAGGRGRWPLPGCCQPGLAGGSRHIRDYLEDGLCGGP